MNWYTQFEKSIKGAEVSSDLIGAGAADAERAMKHYRFQREAKMKEAVEDTFPMLRRFLGESWDRLWNEFFSKNEISPRSLDWFPEVFLTYFQKTPQPLWLKELARFEHALDVHSWSHPALPLRRDLVPMENSQVTLGEFRVISFEAPVISLYEDGMCPEITASQIVLIWQKDDGTYYRATEEWELKVLGALREGVGSALEHAPEDEEKVREFFTWLGSSCLIQGLSQE